jgi:hypothetical protein
MMISFRGLALVLAALVAACAAEPPAPGSPNAARKAPEYRTGSNIPVRQAKPQQQQQSDERARSAGVGTDDKPAN